MVIVYKYDDVGNRLSETLRLPPVTTASPPGGVYKSPLSVTLTCAEPQGPGCDKIYYTTDGTIPTLSSQIYSSPIAISSATTLRFFSRDLSGFRGRREMKTPEFKQAMKRRNAIEGTQSELVRAHGARRARYRGLGKVKLQFYLIGAACNVKRWLKRAAWEIKKGRPLDSCALVSC